MSRHRARPSPLRVLRRTLVGGLLLTSAVALGLAGLLHVQALPVLTGSMRPHLPVGGLVLAQPVPAAEVQVGQVIVFRPPAPWAEPGGRPVVHRVVSVTPGPGGPAVRTKGDANAAADPWTAVLHDGAVARVVAAAGTGGHALLTVKGLTRGSAIVFWPGLFLVWLSLPRRRQGRLAAA